METTTDEKRYNGWHNYATWGVNLILSNDQSTYDRTRELVREGMEDKYPTVRVADAIKDYTEALCGFGDEYGFNDPTMMASQMIYAGLSEVDWDEIAKHWIEDEKNV